MPENFLESISGADRDLLPKYVTDACLFHIGVISYTFPLFDIRLKLTVAVTIIMVKALEKSK